MAATRTVTLTASTWTELSNAENITGSIAIENRSAYNVLLKGTTDGTAPTNDDNAFRLVGGDRGLSLTMAMLWPGSSFVRLWAYSARSDVEVVISYA